MPSLLRVPHGAISWAGWFNFAEVAGPMSASAEAACRAANCCYASESLCVGRLFPGGLGRRRILPVARICGARRVVMFRPGGGCTIHIGADLERIFHLIGHAYRSKVQFHDDNLAITKQSQWSLRNRPGFPEVFWYWGSKQGEPQQRERGAAGCGEGNEMKQGCGASQESGVAAFAEMECHNMAHPPFRGCRPACIAGKG